MQLVIKLAISLAIILVCILVGKKAPTLAGLIATMPLTGFLAMLWIYVDHRDPIEKVSAYTKGAIWGIPVALLFFIVVWACLKQQVRFPIAVIIGFAVWLAGAATHQWLLKEPPPAKPPRTETASPGP